MEQDPLDPVSSSAPNGFTLIEVLVALTVCAISLVAFLQVVSASLRSSDVSNDYVTATLLAESKLDAAGIETPFSEGPSEGSLGDRFFWFIAAQAYQSEEGSSETLAIQPYKVTATVFWMENGRERSVSLTTLRLVQGD